MEKHDNYKNPAVITIKKIHQPNYNYDYYELNYDDENWSLRGELEEILEEIKEHLENIEIKGEK